MPDLERRQNPSRMAVPRDCRREQPIRLTTARRAPFGSPPNPIPASELLDILVNNICSEVTRVLAVLQDLKKLWLVSYPRLWNLPSRGQVCPWRAHQPIVITKCSSMTV